MEKNLKIKTPDKYTIYGILRTPAKKTSTLVVFVHGLVGHGNEHIFFNGARFFSKQGIATFRFNLYDSSKGARRLQTSSLSTHGKDLDAVVKHFRNKYKKIFVVGHSLGTATILFSDTKAVDGFIFWDGVPNLLGIKDKFISYSKKIDAHFIDWGARHVMSKQMFKEWVAMPKPKEAIKRVSKPLKVIVAEKGILADVGRAYYKHAGKSKEFALIKRADHNFNVEGTEEKLFTETYSFVRKYSK